MLSTGGLTPWRSRLLSPSVRAFGLWTGAGVGAVDTVEAEVRELVRRRGLDPVIDRLQMRRLVDEVVTDYDERSLTSALPPLADTRQAARSVYDAVAGFGPLQRHLDDREVEETRINERLTTGVGRREPRDTCRFRAPARCPARGDTERVQQAEARTPRPRRSSGRRCRTPRR